MMRRTGLLFLMGGFSCFVGKPIASVQGFCVTTMLGKGNSGPLTRHWVPHYLNAIPTSLEDDDYGKRAAVLASVPIAWGSFEVAIRYAYAATDIPITPLLFSVAYYAVATAALCLLTLIVRDTVDDGTENMQKSNVEAKENAMATRGGVELGSYLFLGNLLQVIGLQTIPSDRAAFLLQLTTLLVPIAQSLSERTLPSGRIWFACATALFGVGFMTLDGDGSSNLQWELGDTLVICAAVSYTFHCLRLDEFAQKTKPLRLAASKAITELSLSSLFLVSAVLAFGHGAGGFFAQSGEDSIVFLSSLDFSTSVPLGLAILWTGLVPVSYTIYAQSYGQAKVRPVTANLIYTSQPIWTAVFAYSILGERLEVMGYIGGALIGASVLLAVVKQEQESS